MDGYTFAAEFAKALAWPLAAVMIVVLLRHDIRKLLPFLRKAKYGELEVEFGERLEKASENACAILPPPTPRPALAAAESTIAEPGTDRLLALTNDAPAAAILQAWLEVEHAARTVAAQSTNVSEHLPPAQLKRYLIQREMDPAVIAVFDSLRSLRNQAAHGRGLEITPGEAAEYVMLSRRFVDKLSIPRA